MVTLRMHIILANGEGRAGIVDHDIRVLPHGKAPLGGTAENTGWICSAQLDRPREGNQALICFGEDIGVHILHPSTAVRDLTEIFLAPVLFGLLEGTVIGGDGIDISPTYGLPQGVLAGLSLHRGGADKVAAIFPLEYITSKL